MSLDTEPQRFVQHSRVRSPFLTGAAILLLSTGCLDLDAAFAAYCDARPCGADAGSDGGSDGGVIDPPGEPALRVQPPDALLAGDCGAVLIHAIDAEGEPLSPAPGSPYSFTLSAAHELPDGGAAPEVHVGEGCLGESSPTASWQGETGAGPWTASIRSHRTGRVFLQARAAEGTALAPHAAELLVRPRRVKSIELSFLKVPVAIGSCVNGLLHFTDEHGDPIPAGMGISATLQRSGGSHANLFASSDCAGEGNRSIEVSPQGPEPTPFSYRPLADMATTHQFEALVMGDSGWVLLPGALPVVEGVLQLKPQAVQGRVGVCTLLMPMLVDMDTGDSVPHAGGNFALSVPQSDIQLFARGDAACTSPLPLGTPLAFEAGQDFGFRLKADTEYQDLSWQMILEGVARGGFTTTFLASAPPDGFIFGPFAGTGPEVFSAAAECNSIPISLFSGMQGTPVPAHEPIRAEISSNDPLLVFGAHDCELATLQQIEIEFDRGQTTREVFFKKLENVGGTATLSISTLMDGGVPLDAGSQEITLE